MIAQTPSLIMAKKTSNIAEYFGVLQTIENIVSLKFIAAVLLLMNMMPESASMNDIREMVRGWCSGIEDEKLMRRVSAADKMNRCQYGFGDWRKHLQAINSGSSSDDIERACSKIVDTWLESQNVTKLGMNTFHKILNKMIREEENNDKQTKRARLSREKDDRSGGSLYAEFTRQTRLQTILQNEDKKETANDADELGIANSQRSSKVANKAFEHTMPTNIKQSSEKKQERRFSPRFTTNLRQQQQQQHNSLADIYLPDGDSESSNSDDDDTGDEYNSDSESTSKSDEDYDDSDDIYEVLNEESRATALLSTYGIDHITLNCLGRV